MTVETYAEYRQDGDHRVYWRTSGPNILVGSVQETRDHRGSLLYVAFVYPPWCMVAGKCSHFDSLEAGLQHIASVVQQHEEEHKEQHNV